MFNTTIPLYGIMLLLALTMNVVVVLCVYKKFNFSFLEIVAALVYENVGIILGGKLLTLLQNYSLYKNVDILVDFLGYVTYESYTSSDIPIIKVPDPSINGQNISKEQETTLIKLAIINNDDLAYLPFENKQKVKLKK